ncbi:hypothetical protein, variant [Verruconis gallopava]|nr:hypothetical protein, variant [Verruconis gallopava]KIW07112.1 hypothetical protein, variant [Verruconis gallopava]
MTVSFKGRALERADRISTFYVLEDWALNKDHANRIFLKFKGKSWTYRQAYELALKYGTWFKQKYGIKKDEIVAMDFVNSDIYIWVWFGLWSIGAKPAFINYNLTNRPLIHTIKTSTARYCFAMEQFRREKYDGEVLDELSGPNFRDAGGPVEVVFLDAATRAEIEAVMPVRAPDSERGGQQLKGMALLIYTSGTTGLPKPAIVSWSKACMAGWFVSKWLPIKPEDTFYTCMPLYHSSGSLLGMTSALRAGASFSLGERFHRKGFWDDCRATDATIIQYVGETLRYLLSVPPSPSDRNHKVRTAFGNGLRPDVWPVFKERFGIETIVEFYAATEGPAALWNKSKNKYTEGAVGVSGILNQLLGAPAQVILLDFETNAPIRDKKTGLCIPVKPGQPGELIYKLDEKEIDATFQGYFGNNKATSSKIHRDVLKKGDAYFSTGDLLRKDSEGRWYFCDRIGDTFRWKSENVSTAEVAEVMGRISLINEANVYGVQIPGHDGRAGCAALVLQDEQKPLTESELAEIGAQATKGLPRYAVPIFLRVHRGDAAAANRTGTMKQQKTVLRNEGVNPALVSKSGDELFWLPPNSKAYQRFGEKEWNALGAGTVKL